MFSVLQGHQSYQNQEVVSQLCFFSNTVQMLRNCLLSQWWKCFHSRHIDWPQYANHSLNLYHHLSPATTPGVMWKHPTLQQSTGWTKDSATSSWWVLLVSQLLHTMKEHTNWNAPKMLALLSIIESTCIFYYDMLKYTCYVIKVNKHHTSVPNHINTHDPKPNFITEGLNFQTREIQEWLHTDNYKIYFWTQGGFNQCSHAVTQFCTLTAVLFFEWLSGRSQAFVSLCCLIDHHVNAL